MGASQPIAAFDFFSRNGKSAATLREQRFPMGFLTLTHKLFYALMRMQQIRQRFSAIALEVLSEIRKDSVARFVKIDFSANHAHPGSIFEMSL
jgi:hypothetical protein